MPLDLGFLILLAIVSAGLGFRLLRWLGLTPDEPLDAWALATPLGLGCLSLAVLGLAEAGWLTPGAIVALLLASGLSWLPLALGEGWGEGLGLAVGVRNWLDRTSLGRRCPSPPAPLPGGEGRQMWARRSWPGFAFDGLLAVTLLGTLVTSLAPVTDGDALCYHLQVPKVFLAHHSAVFEPDLHETIYPLVTEALYAVGLGLRGPVACRLIQWLLGLAFAANVAAIARPVLGDRARWAGTLALLVPAISNGMGAPLNDVALAAFGNAAIHGWIRWRDRPSIRGAILAGMLAGLAIGVKYPALVLVGLLGLGSFASRKKTHVLTFGLVALVVGGGWYLRAYVHTGNPVYPFFRQVFGGAGIDEVLDPKRRAMVVNAWNLLTVLGPMTLRPDRFDSFSHQFGPMFLLFLPALLWMRPPRRILGVVALGYAFLTLCLTQRQSMRFVLIAVGPMAVGVAWLASEWWDRRSVPGRVLIGLMLAMMAFEASLAVVRGRHGLKVVLGRESAESYLSRREPTFAVGRWMAGNLPSDAKVIGQDHRGFYLPRDYSMELAHRRRTGLGKHGESASEVVEGLRSAGFTHVLLCPPVPENAVEFDPTLGRLLAPWLASARPLYRRDLADADGIVRRYAIYDLDRPLQEARR